MRTFLPVLAWLCLAFPSFAQDEIAANDPLDSLRLRRNVCPFECCHYGRWTALNEIAVYKRERDTTQITTVIPEGEEFDAISGNVFVERFGEVDMLQDFVAWGEEAPRYHRGDTVLLLDYQGEGWYTVWTRGSLLDDGDFFVLPSDTSDIPLDHVFGVLRVAPVSHWWVMVRLSDGIDGWIDMEKAIVRGSDACG